MNLLVTGGAGFIGSHFVLRHRELHPDDTIVVLDALSHGSNKAFLDPVIQRIRFVTGDIADAELVSSILTRYAIDTIVNFAAETHVDRSIKSAVPFLHSNILGVQALIEVLRANPTVRMLHISTDEVYGDVGDGDRSRTIEDAVWPSSPYSASKGAGELLLLSAKRTFGINIAISRCTNNYGPHQDNEKFIPTVIRKALANQKVPIYAQGKNRRDWLYVTDHTDALEVMLQHEWPKYDGKPSTAEADARKGFLFNVSADDDQQNINVAKTILKILGKPESLLEFVADRPGHDWRYAIDSSATRALGWKPKVSFEEGIKKTIEWFQKA